jgi:hypothetical protein
MMPRFSAAGRRLSETSIFELRGARLAESLGFFQSANDQIMGGISQSSLVPWSASDCACFTGIVRTDGGGFCGTRTRLFSTPLDLTGNSGLYLRVRGDGTRRFKMNVRTSEATGELVYQCAFLPPPAERGAEATTIRLPFSAFRLVRRSEPVLGAPPLDPKSIFQMGFVLSRFAFGEASFNDAFAAGPFRLEIEEIGAYRDELDFVASIDDSSGADAAALSRAAGPPLSTQLELWLEGKEPRVRMGLRARLLRFVFRRFQKTVQKRVVARRSDRAAQLWAMRKEGKRLSEIRRAETEGVGKTK